PAGKAVRGQQPGGRRPPGRAGTARRQVSARRAAGFAPNGDFPARSGALPMPVLRFACPSCEVALKVRDLPPGKRIACPKCKKVFGPPAAAPAKPAPSGWYVTRGQKKSGPYPLPMLRQMASAGRLAREDRLLPEGATEWVAAGSFKSL